MNKIICLLFGHKYRLLRKITPYIRECYCKRCNEKFAMNDYVKCLLPLDDELIALHNEELDIKL